MEFIGDLMSFFNGWLEMWRDLAVRLIGVSVIGVTSSLDFRSLRHDTMVDQKWLEWLKFTVYQPLKDVFNHFLLARCYQTSFSYVYPSGWKPLETRCHNLLEIDHQASTRIGPLERMPWLINLGDWLVITNSIVMVGVSKVGALPPRVGKTIAMSQHQTKTYSNVRY